MLQETVGRLLKLIDIEHIFVCTGEVYRDICKSQLPELPEKNIIIEPAGRNTAPCILLSTLYIRQMCGETNIIVLPSDHQINNEQEFLSVLADADKFVSKQKESIITIGIKPNRPETGYGYINFMQTVDEIGSHEIKKVNRFVEKPDRETAQAYLEDGHYLWNAGMFLFGTDFMLGEYNRYAKETYTTLSSLPAISSPDYMKALKEKYSECENISVDFAIMEKTKSLYVIPADFEWDDIGAWKALERYLECDEQGNIVKGNVRTVNSSGNLVYSTGREVILLDADDLFVIQTDEKIVVGRRGSLEKVRELRDK